MDALLNFAQAAAEYGAMAGGAATGPSSRGAVALLDQLPFDVTNPLVIAGVVLGVLIVAGFARTGRYRA